MRRWAWILFFLVIIFGVEKSLAVDFKGGIGFNFDWWEDTKDHKARQSYTPLFLEGRYKDFTLSFLTGYCYTRMDPDKESPRSFRHVLDSKLNLSYEIIDKLPVDLLVGLDFNLPTGKTDRKLKEQSLILDPYLITITQFGEGFNINPTLSLAKEWRKWVLGVGVGYLWRGRYDFGNIDETPYSIIKIKNYSPGNIFTLNSEIRYEFTPQWQGRLFGNYLWYEKSKWKESYRDIWGFTNDLNRFLKEGELWLLGLGINYKSRKWDSDLTIKGIFRERNKFDYKEEWDHFDSYWWWWATDTPSLTKEIRNSHGDEWVGNLSIKYFLDEMTTIKSFFQALFIKANDYPSFSPHYQGRREKYTLGFGLNRKVIRHLEAEIYVKGFVMHDGERKLSSFGYPGYQTLSDRHYKGFSGGLMLTTRF